MYEVYLPKNTLYTLTVSLRAWSLTPHPNLVPNHELLMQAAPHISALASGVHGDEAGARTCSEQLVHGVMHSWYVVGVLIR